LVRRGRQRQPGAAGLHERASGSGQSGDGTDLRSLHRSLSADLFGLPDQFRRILAALLEASPQAQFLIAMTLSLSAELLFGMAASLILTPVCYAILGK